MSEPQLARAFFETTVPPYHVQTTARRLEGGFPYFAHHDSISALWSQKWRAPCAAGIYPFDDAQVADFNPIFEYLAEATHDDPSILTRPDDYARSFMPMAGRLAGESETAESDSDTKRARDRFLRAAAVYRIARFPVNRSPVTQRAWELGKDAYIKGGAYLDPPNIPVDIPFAQANPQAGDTAVPIPAFLRIPRGQAPAEGWPVLLFVCGLDAYRTDNTSRVQEHTDRGFATVSFEIPGTGDCPAAPRDPASPNRLMSSVLDWVVDSADDLHLNPSRAVLRGISTGGYYAIRASHTHADRLFAVAQQGGGCHHMFDPSWIGAQNQMEYLFALADALAYKFGFRDGDSPVTDLRRARTSLQPANLRCPGHAEHPAVAGQRHGGLDLPDRRHVPGRTTRKRQGRRRPRQQGAHGQPRRRANCLPMDRRNT